MWRVTGSFLMVTPWWRRSIFRPPPTINWVYQVGRRVGLLRHSWCRCASAPRHVYLAFGQQRRTGRHGSTHPAWTLRRRIGRRHSGTDHSSGFVGQNHFRTHPNPQAAGMIIPLYHYHGLRRLKPSHRHLEPGQPMAQGNHVLRRAGFNLLADFAARSGTHPTCCYKRCPSAAGAAFCACCWWRGFLPFDTEPTVKAVWLNL